MGGELLLPTSRAAGLLGRGAVWLAFPLALWALRVPSAAERAALVRLARPRELLASMRERIADSVVAASADAPPDARRGGFAVEVYEVEDVDEDVDEDGASADSEENGSIAPADTAEDADKPESKDVVNQ